MGRLLVGRVVEPVLSRPGATGAAALAALVAASLAAATGCGGGGAPRERGQAARTFAVDGLTVSQFEGTRLARRLRSDQLVVVPKRFGPLRVAGLDEVVLARARLELLEPPDGSRGSGGGAVLSRRTIETAAAGRRVAGASIHGLEVDVSRGGVLQARVTAARGTLALGSGDLALEEFAVDELAPVARSIRGARAAWRTRERAIVIDGPYELREGGRVTRGTRLRVALGR